MTRSDPGAQDTFDARLRELLDAETRAIPGAPSREAMVDRLALALGIEQGPGAFRARTEPAPLLRVVLVLGLLAALVTGAIIVGSRLRDGDLLVVAPSQSSLASPPTSPAWTYAPTAQPAELPLTVDACPDGTRANDIVLHPTPGRARWVSGAQPVGARPAAPRQIAVVGTTTADPRSRGIHLVDLASGEGCVLVELPSGWTVRNIMWARSGDALAIGVEGGRGLDVLVWSALGTTALNTGNDTVTWAPDGSGVLDDAEFVRGGPSVGSNSAGLRFLPADGSPARTVTCEPARTEPCPQFPMIAWSPDSTRFAVQGGEGSEPPLFSIASLDDLQLHPIDAGMDNEPEIVFWADSSTLMVAHGDSLYLVPIDQPRASSLVGPRPRIGFDDGDASPDLAWISFVTADAILVRELATGAMSTVVRPADIGTDLGFYQVEWSPDSRGFAFTMSDESIPLSQTGSAAVAPGLWVVGRDGTGLHQITTLSDAAIEDGIHFSWRPAWP